MPHTPPEYEAAVAREVERAMRTAGLTVLDLAEKTTIPRVTLQRNLAGLTPFNARQLKLIASALGTAPSAFLLAAEGDAA